MKKIIFSLLYLSATLLNAQTISDKAFGMHWNSAPKAYATYKFQAFAPTRRLWDSQTKWLDIETSAGVYDWTRLDARVNDAVNNGAEIVYTLGGTPAFYSANATDANCNYQAGACWAPTDVTSGDTKLKNFITALINHVGLGKIKYFECWNEPNVKGFWADTLANLKTVCTDYYRTIKAKDPSAKVLMAPSFHTSQTISIQTMLSNGFGAISDINSFHGKHCPAEAVISETNTIKADFAGAGLGGRELWNTEGGWKNNAGCPLEERPATLARLYILNFSQGVSRYYWYSYDNQTFGTLATGGVPNASETAYRQVVGWLAGATMTSSCTASGSVWKCGLTKSGIQYQAIWNTAGNSTETVGSQYVSYKDLIGNTNTISNHTVRIGLSPILLVSSEESSLPNPPTGLTATVN